MGCGLALLRSGHRGQGRRGENAGSRWIAVISVSGAIDWYTVRPWRQEDGVWPLARRIGLVAAAGAIAWYTACLPHRGRDPATDALSEIGSPPKCYRLVHSLLVGVESLVVVEETLRREQLNAIVL